MLRQRSEPLAGDQNEENQERRVDDDGDGEHHEGTLHKELPHVGLPHAGEVERRVLAQADQGQDRIQRVLVGSQAVDTEGEGEDKL